MHTHARTHAHMYVYIRPVCTHAWVCMYIYYINVCTYIIHMYIHILHIHTQKSIPGSSTDASRGPGQVALADFPF